MIEIDPISLLVTADTDTPLDALEAQVAAEGFTLNYRPVPDAHALLADALSQRLPNLYAPAFDGIDDLCIQLKLAQANGTVFTNVKTPRSAAGPSLKKMAIGAAEWLGIPIQATLRIFPRPTHHEIRAFAFAQERDLEAFQKSLQRLRWPLPLCARLDAREAASILEGVSLLEPLLAFSWWGAELWMERYGEALEDLAEGKQGRRVELRPGRDVEDLGELLRSRALAESLDRIEARRAELSRGHRDLSAFLKEAR